MNDTEMDLQTTNHSQPQQQQPPHISGPRSNKSSPSPTPTPQPQPPSPLPLPQPDYQQPPHYQPRQNSNSHQNGQTSAQLYQRLRHDYPQLVTKAAVNTPQHQLYRNQPGYPDAGDHGPQYRETGMAAVDRNLLKTYSGRVTNLEEGSSLWKSEQRDSDTGSVITASGVMLGPKQSVILGPKRPKPHKVWRKRFVKILVVGDSGLGKTTLIRTLLSVPGESIQLHDGSGTSLQIFQRKPEVLCSELTWQDEDDKIQWIYKIQDTPGYGDVLNLNKHIQAICEYVNKQNKAWLDLEMHRRRNQDLQNIEDPRVDICIFCLPPHRVHASDLRYMHELSQAVPIVPVVTKADTMTALEGQQYRQEVYNSIKGARKLPGVRGAINLFSFEDETLERCHIAQLQGKRNMPPFLVIGSNDINEEMAQRDPPVYWPERNYPWGTSEAFNPEHSDLIYLRLLMLKEGAEEISQATKKRYEDWRRGQLTKFRVGHRLKQVLLGACSVVGITVVVLAATSKGDMTQVANKINSAQKRIGEKVKSKSTQKEIEESATKVEKKKSGWF